MTNAPQLIDLHPKKESFRDEVVAGLGKLRKELPAKFFYDKRGSELFEEITRLPEYYVTRTEIEILDQNAEEMIRLMGENFLLVEFGSGSSTKVRILLDQMQGKAAYTAIDISLLYLKESAQALGADYPEVQVTAVCADYTRPFLIPEGDDFEKRVAFFPGSTVGNFEPHLARKFFRDTARRLRQNDTMLIGVDLQKDRRILHAAYNDSAGITAAFNKNILLRINRELGADFDPDRFDHAAFYNEKENRIEMHLRSRGDQKVTIGADTFAFRDQETIHTENSYKYTVESFHELLKETGFEPEKVWMDPRKLFSVHYLKVAERRGTVVAEHSDSDVRSR